MQEFTMPGWAWAAFCILSLYGLHRIRVAVYGLAQVVANSAQNTAQNDLMNQRLIEIERGLERLTEVTEKIEFYASETSDHARWADDKLGNIDSSLWKMSEPFRRRDEILP
jgi:hypothetical protein